MEPDNSVRRAYRTAFGEYARKLDELQRLLDDRAADKHQLEPAIREVEKARVAHNTARDLLARQLLSEEPRADASTDSLAAAAR
jgi:hypothetical protein